MTIQDIADSDMTLEQWIRLSASDREQTGLVRAMYRELVLAVWKRIIEIRELDRLYHA